MLRRMVRPPLHVRADRSRGGVQDRHAVALDDVPPAILVREVGRPLVDDRGGAVTERPVDDVRVPGDPADVGRAPVNVSLGLQVEDVVVRGRNADEVAACRMHDPLRFRGRPRRVHEEEQVLRVHRLARTRRGVVRDVELVEPGVAILLHLDVPARAADDEAAPHARRGRHRLVRGALERDARAAPPGLVLGDEHLATHVVHAVRQRVRREAAEYDRVGCADPRAGKHHRRQLRDHPHVDRDRRALADSELLQRVREPDDVALELRVGDLAPVAFWLAFPEIGGLVAATRIDVTVDAVEADVELPAQVPLRVGKLPLVQLPERLEPGHTLAAVGLPELLEVAFVDLWLGVRLCGELGRRRVTTLLQKKRVDGLVGHVAISRSYGNAVRFS